MTKQNRTFALLKALHCAGMVVGLGNWQWYMFFEVPSGRKRKSASRTPEQLPDLRMAHRSPPWNLGITQVTRSRGSRAFTKSWHVLDVIKLTTLKTIIYRKFLKSLFLTSALRIAKSLSGNPNSWLPLACMCTYTLTNVKNPETRSVTGHPTERQIESRFTCNQAKSEGLQRPEQLREY